MIGRTSRGSPYGLTVHTDIRRGWVRTVMLALRAPGRSRGKGLMSFVYKGGRSLLYGLSVFAISILWGKREFRNIT